MSALDPDDELVPLHTDFDVVWRGCDRGQVADYVDRVETELRILEVDRDAATRRADALAEQLEAARAEIQRLTHHQDRLAAEAEQRAAEAAARRRALDEQAEEERDRVRTDFELAMKARRAELMRELADQRAAAEEEAARLVDSARAEADRLVAEVRDEVARLYAQRDRVLESLRAAGDAVAAAGSLLEPLPGEERGTRAA